MQLPRISLFGAAVLTVGAVLAGHTNVAESEVIVVSTELIGQVKDVCGRVIPGATVTIVNESGTPYRAITDGDGRYVFRDLASTRDPWVLGVEAIGFEKERRAEIRLREGVSLELNIRLLRAYTAMKTAPGFTDSPGGRELG